MELRSYARLFRRRWLAVLILTLLGGAVGAGLSWSLPPTYKATTGLFVSTSPGSDLAQAYQGNLLAQQSAKSFSTLTTDDNVLRIIISRLGLPYSIGELRNEIHASNPDGTALIQLDVNDRSAPRAEAIANAYGPVFSQFVAGLGRPGHAQLPAGSGTLPALQVTAIGPAENQTVSQHRSLNVALGLSAGLILGIVWAVIREATDSRLRDADEVHRAADVRVLGVVPKKSNTRTAARTEAYHRLAVNLQSANTGRGAVCLVVAGPTGGEHAYGVAADLATCFAEGGDRTILVDADPARTRRGGPMDLPPGSGLRQVLSDWLPVDRALRPVETGIPLSVLPSGTSDQLSRGVLREDRLTALRAELTDRADVVIFAAPAILVHSSAVMLARSVGQVLVIVRAGQTGDRDLAEAVRLVREAGATVAGVVISHKGSEAPDEAPPVRAGRPVREETLPTEARSADAHAVDHGHV